MSKVGVVVLKVLKSSVYYRGWCFSNDMVTLDVLDVGIEFLFLKLELSFCF